MSRDIRCSVFFLFILISESYHRNNSWNPCPVLRASFEGILEDNDGAKHPICACNDGYFGEKCDLKVYISGLEGLQRKGISYQQNFRSSDHRIFPLELLRVSRYSNGSTLVLWQHTVVGFVKHYALHFRQIYTKDGISTASIWKALVNIKPEYFSGQNISTPRGYLFEHFLNTTGYEINLAIVSNKTILVSASIFADAMDSHHLREERLGEVWYNPSPVWSAWNTWGKCTTEKGCGRGSQMRTSVLKRERCISEKTEETRPCKLKRCPVNGGWSPWVSWTPCSVSCGNGTKSRTRTCTNPVPKDGGKVCFGIRRNKKSCVKGRCPGTEVQRRKWASLEKFKNLHFTSVIIGAAGGFMICLLMMTCPRLLKRCKRIRKRTYKPIVDKEPKLEDNDANFDGSGLWRIPLASNNNNWNAISTKIDDNQKDTVDSVFMNELMNAFRNFKVLETTENNSTY